LTGREGHVGEGERRHAKGFATIRRLDEGGPSGVLGAIAEGTATICLPGDVDRAVGRDRDVRPLVVTQTAADLHRSAERRAVVGRPRQKDLIAAAAVEVGPGGVDVAVVAGATGLVDVDPGLVI